MRAVLLIISVIGISGCTTVRHWFHHEKPVALTQAERSAIIADCAGLLTAQFLPAKTTLRFPDDPNDRATAQLKDVLRTNGFAVTNESDLNCSDAKLTLMQFGRGSFLVRVRVSTYWDAARLYNRNSQGLEPACGFSVRNDGDPNHG